MSELYQRVRGLQRSLSEAVAKAPLGTVVGWRTPAGRDFGVVVGREGRDLICLTIYEKKLRGDKSVAYYRDEALTSKLSQAALAPGIVMDVQRVPAKQAHRRDHIRGAMLKPYLAAATHLQLEAEGYGEMAEALTAVREYLEERSGGRGRLWIKKAVKHKGRLAKILGVAPEQYKELDKREKLRLINSKLRDLEGRKGREARSKRGALLLGKRFVRGISKERARRRMP